VIGWEMENILKLYIFYFLNFIFNKIY
jgi:hypothetical protein